jgi:hypothetical protein
VYSVHHTGCSLWIHGGLATVHYEEVSSIYQVPPAFQQINISHTLQTPLETVVLLLLRPPSSVLRSVKFAGRLLSSLWRRMRFPFGIEPRTGGRANFSFYIFDLASSEYDPT